LTWNGVKLPWSWELSLLHRVGYQYKFVQFKHENKQMARFNRKHLWFLHKALLANCNPSADVAIVIIRVEWGEGLNFYFVYWNWGGFNSQKSSWLQQPHGRAQVKNFLEFLVHVMTSAKLKLNQCAHVECQKVNDGLFSLSLQDFGDSTDVTTQS
jgi:hypothetical protein